MTSDKSPTAYSVTVLWTELEYSADLEQQAKRRCRLPVPFPSYLSSWVDGVQHLLSDDAVFVVVAIPSAPHSGQHFCSMMRMIPHIVEGFVRRQPFIHCVKFSLQAIEGL